MVCVIYRAIGSAKMNVALLNTHTSNSLNEQYSEPTGRKPGSIPPDRLWSTGQSNGGFLAQLVVLICKYSGKTREILVHDTDKKRGVKGNG